MHPTFARRSVASGFFSCSAFRHALKTTFAAGACALLLAPAYAYPPVGIDPGDTGGTGSGSGQVTNPGASAGPPLPWEGSLGDVKTGIGSKATVVPLVAWTARGGLPVDFTLYHASQSGRNFSVYSPKWSSTYDTWISTSTGYVTVNWGDQTSYSFTQSGTTYTPPTGIHDTLTLTSGAFDLVSKEGITYHFAQTVTGNTSYFLTTIKDENGNTVTIARNTSNARITTVTDPTGRTLTYGYDGSGRMSTVTTAPLSRTWTLGYDGSSHLTSVTFPVVHDADSTAHTDYVNFGYDTNNNINAYTDRRGKVWTAFYNTTPSTDNSIAWEKDPYLNQTSFDYGHDRSGTANSGAVTITDPNGKKTQQTYDTTTGRLASETDALGKTESYLYDTNNNRTQLTDRRGKLWKWTSYDGNGNLLTAKDPYLKSTTYTYTGYSRLQTTTLPTGRSVKNYYDTHDNLTKTEEKDQTGTVISTTTYTPNGYGLTTDKYNTYNSSSHHYV